MEDIRLVNEIAELVNSGETTKAVTILQIERGLAYQDGQMDARLT